MMIALLMNADLTAACKLRVCAPMCLTMPNSIYTSVVAKPTGGSFSSVVNSDHTLARFLQSKVTVPGAVPGSAKLLEETDMNKLTINDLAAAKQLDKRQMAGLLGGMGRTPAQILAWELTGQPATWQGLVLGNDNQLHVPPI
jgi:hypothetical protein